VAVSGGWDNDNFRSPPGQPPVEDDHWNVSGPVPRDANHLPVDMETSQVHVRAFDIDGVGGQQHKRCHPRDQ